MKVNSLSKIYSIIGYVFIISSLFSIIVIYSTTEKLSKDIELYNNSEIIQKGKNAEATITNISPLRNISINGENPIIISYTYRDINNIIHFDRFQTFDISKTISYRVGVNIAVKYLNNQSVIENLKPYKLSLGIFYLIPLVFFIVGVLFVLVRFFIGNIPKIR